MGVGKRQQTGIRGCGKLHPPPPSPASFPVSSHTVWTTVSEGVVHFAQLIFRVFFFGLSCCGQSKTTSVSLTKCLVTTAIKGQ